VSAGREAVRSAILASAWLLVGIRMIRSNTSRKLLQRQTSNLIHGYVWGMPSVRTNNFP